MRSTLGRAGQLHRRTARLEAERAELASWKQQEETRHAVTQERLRIARELHDVVGHSLSVIALQAGVCARIVDSDPAEARSGLLAIAERSRSSLRGCEHILSAIRETDEPDCPAPGLADTDTLFSGFSDAGLRLGGTSRRAVAAARRSRPHRLPGGAEALTNVVRHAGTDRAWVRIGSNLTGSSCGSVTTVWGAAGPEAAGLAGMSERVGAWGRRLTAGPIEGGGYEVVAMLPRRWGRPVIRVLLADDEALIRSGLAVLLRHEPGFEVVGSAADGLSAVRLAHEQRPDVVLMDVRMPGIDGIEATRRLVADPATASVRVLILTTFDHDANVFATLHAGASGFCPGHRAGSAAGGHPGRRRW